MAHWAEIDENNTVLRVTVGDNNDPDEGYQWLVDNLGGRWIKTSYNATIRRKFAGIGDIYNEELDGFQPPQPFASWTFNAADWVWESPEPYPSDGLTYLWDEPTSSWQLVDFS